VVATSIKKIVKHDRLPHQVRTFFHYATVYLQDVKRCDLTKQASAMAYITLFSLIPSLAALFTLLGLFLPILGSHANLLDDARQFLFKYLATGSGTQVVGYLEGFIAGLNLKKIGMSAFVGLMFTLVMLLRQIEEALNRIWLVTEARPMVTRFIYFWLFITLGMFAISILLGLSTSYSITTLITRKTLAVADHADDIPVVAYAMSWLGSCGVFYLVYKIVPNCEVKARPAVRGAMMAGTVFFILSKTYAFYVSKLSYASVYGTLAALPIFLMWIYFCWIVVLSGALFAWRVQTGFPPEELEKSVEAETTHLERLRNQGIRSRLPLAVLFAIHHKFIDGTSEGLSTSDIVSQLKLPHEWVFESLELLRDQKLIVHAKVSHSKISALTESDRWFPTSPASTIRVGQFLDQVNAPLRDWLETWSPELPSAPLRQFMKGQSNQDLEKSLDMLLKTN
jgi:membrane protein